MFHCLNRGNDRNEIFAKDGDCAAFEKSEKESEKEGRKSILGRPHYQRLEVRAEETC